MREYFEIIADAQLAHAVVCCADLGVPQARRRLVAGPPIAIELLQAREQRCRAARAREGNGLARPTPLEVLNSTAAVARVWTGGAGALPEHAMLQV